MSARTDLRLLDGAHVVQFFSRDEQLDVMVGGYLAASALAGEAVIVIAAPARTRRMVAALVDAGVRVDTALAEGRLTLLDAATTLEQLLFGGALDARRFDAVVGTVVRRAAADGRPVRAYGEMVALLWEAGDVAGAAELERLWNSLGAHVPFALFCGYPGRVGADSSELCGLHSEVISGAPAATDAEVGRRFTSNLQAPRMARHFLTETLQGWGRDDLLDDGQLVVTELATNAAVHAGSDFTVTLSRRGAGVRVVVGDTSRLTPLPSDPAMASLGGHGLHLVGALTSRWGHDLVPGGKVVWADLLPS